MKIEVLVGMIASGKSTYANRRAKEGALIVSHDDLTEMLHGEYRYEKGLRNCYRGMEGHIAVQGLLSGRDVIIDRTHLTLESRARWVGLAKTTNAIFQQSDRGNVWVIAVVFPVELPQVHAVRRLAADARGRSYNEWHAVASHHHDQATTEPISDAEGFSEIIRL